MFKNKSTGDWGGEMKHSVRCDLNHCIGECQPEVNPLEEIANDITKQNCFCNCEDVVGGCTVKRDRVKEALESYGKQEYQRGIDDAATIFEFESCIDHEFVHGEAICVAARIRSLAEKK